MFLPSGNKFVKTHSGLIESFLSLSVLNGVNIILPLITLPYLVRTVGLSKFGAYSIVYTVLQYVLLISTYGFNYTTTKLVAQNKDNISYIRVVFNSTILARLLISVPSLFVGFLLVLVIYPADYSWLYLGGIGIVLGDIINPVWLFQGYEKMRYMAAANFVCKLLFTVLIFVFIRSEQDYIYINLLNSLGFMAAGVISLFISMKCFDIKIVAVKFSDVIFQLKEGWSIFLSTIFMNLYRNSNVFILGFFLSEYNVGVYSTAEKVVKAVQSVVAPISNALFPYFASSFKSSSISDNAKRILRTNGKLVVLLFVVAFLFVVFSDLINDLLFDVEESNISLLMRVMSPVIVIGGMNYVLGVAGLVNLGHNLYFLKAVTVSGVVSLLALFPLVQLMGVFSGAVSMIMAEIILFAYCFIMVKRLAL